LDDWYSTPSDAASQVGIVDSIPSRPYGASPIDPVPIIAIIAARCLMFPEQRESTLFPAGASN
jgi:hypothetical protein